jgi:hypothetical protein
MITSRGRAGMAGKRSTTTDRGGTGIGANFLITVCVGIGVGPRGGRSRRTSGGGVGSGGARCRMTSGRGAGGYKNIKRKFDNEIISYLWWTNFLDDQCL